MRSSPTPHRRAPLRWDAPLVACLARELDGRLRNARLRALAPEFDTRRLALHFAEATVVVRLHPRESGVFVLEAADPPEGARRLAARLRGVHAVPDERILEFSFLRNRGSPAQVDVVIEWITNRHNAVVCEGPDRIARMVFQTREGDRVVRQGQPYTPPPLGVREGVDGPVSEERWRQLVAEADDPRRAILSTLAWTSPLNVKALLDPDPAVAWARWAEVGRVARGEHPATPVVLDTDRGPQPYPLPLPGVPHEPVADLVTAMARAAEGDTGTAPSLVPGALVERLESWVESLRARCASLEEERDGLEDPERIQARGDLLLARFREVPRGAETVRLTGFDGTLVEISLDPRQTPEANARAFYDEAARIRRAHDRLPGLIDAARAAWADAEALLERARRGEAEPHEITGAIPSGRATDDAGGPALPYRRYRSSGGLEIRVGRGAKHNDELTFRHSAPDDVWLHARDVAGAHVILRWNRDDNPPARDLAEAAVLAALGSKARTSGSVPVDWTRRKYVRKPRKAPPGAVVPDRVKTVFVEPDGAVEQRLRAE